jgi:hypothetical protein
MIKGKFVRCLLILKMLKNQIETLTKGSSSPLEGVKGILEQ